MSDGSSDVSGVACLWIEGALPGRPVVVDSVRSETDPGGFVCSLREPVWLASNRHEPLTAVRVVTRGAFVPFVEGAVGLELNVLDMQPPVRSPVGHRSRSDSPSEASCVEDVWVVSPDPSARRLFAGLLAPVGCGELLPGG